MRRDGHNLAGSDDLLVKLKQLNVFESQLKVSAALPCSGIAEHEYRVCVLF